MFIYLNNLGLMMRPMLLEPVKESTAWKAEDVKDQSRWMYELTERDIAELDAAVKSYSAKDLRYPDVARGQFPLPTFAQKLLGIPQVMEHGLGFLVLRGIPVERYTLEEARIALWGIGTYIGNAISQNARGEVLCSVTDHGGRYGTKTARGYQTSDRLDFHCDNSDVVGLLFLKTAKSGGLSLLSSAMAMYNELLVRRPDLLELAYRGYYYDLRGEQREGVGDYTDHRIPIFSYHEGRLSCRYVRNGIELGATATGKSLTAADIELFDLLDELARSDELCLSADFKPGDLQIVNNHTTMHARTDYEDYPEPERRRHALRLWLNLDEGRPLTEEFASRYGPNSGRLGVPPVERPPEHIAKS